MVEVTKKKIFKTAIMPEYYPRVKQLLGSGFGNLAFFIAVVYNTVRILPNNHPYLKRENRGRFSTRQVIAQAANHISLKKENIDQILVFFSVIAAMVIMFMQFILLAIALIIPKSFAQDIPDDIRDFFVTQSPDKDIAFNLMNLVFGIPEFFGGAAEIREPIHRALHSLFEFYSIGILIVGAFIILYMVVTTIAETAQSGMPFGRRFNKAWTPIRLVFFFALLLPITWGINSAQYITLMSAKLGSSVASNGWILYNEVLAEGGGDGATTLSGRVEQNVAIPKKENLMHVPAFLMVAKTCGISYTENYNVENFPDSWIDGILAWAVYETEDDVWGASLIEDTTYETLITNSNGQDVFIVFGVRDAGLYKTHPASVAPICGSMVLSATDASQPGAAKFRLAYYELVKSIWTGIPAFTDYAPTQQERLLYFAMEDYSRAYYELGVTIVNPVDLILPDHNYKIGWQKHLDRLMEGPNGNDGIIQVAVDEQINQGKWQMDPEIAELGWAGAGVWYNKIAEQNGAIVSALRNVPKPGTYPRVLEKVENSNRSENVAGNPLDRFTITYAPETPAIFVTEYENEIARASNYAFTFWNDKNTGANPSIPKTGNTFIDIINMTLGTQGLFELCRNTDVHPLAQLSAVGKSMLDNSIKAFGGSALFGLFGLQPLFKATTGAISEFFGTIASVGLLIGFVLFYVLPFMPFIYFFFAVGAWVKTVFEAMVAMPLWALAHLRIDGDGVMGDAAMGGYYLIFEIFIRPILIVFGLISSIVIFAVMVKVLNQIFHLVIANMGGYDMESSLTGCFQNPDAAVDDDQVIPRDHQQEQLDQGIRGPIDEFFFTIVYAITVYMIGTACFKLIDGIPNNILRWMNAEVSSFGDDAGDAAEGLMKYVTLGGSQFGSQLGASLKGVGSGATQTTQKMLSGEFLG